MIPLVAKMWHIMESEMTQKKHIFGKNMTHSLKKFFAALVSIVDISEISIAFQITVGAHV